MKSGVTMTCAPTLNYALQLYIYIYIHFFFLRSLTDASGASPSKFSRQYIHLPVEHGNAVNFEGAFGIMDVFVIVWSVEDIMVARLLNFG